MKKSFAFDLRLGVLAVFVMLCGFFCKIAGQDGETEMKAILCFFMLILIAVITLSPHFYTADEKGLTVYYIFFIKDYYDWEDVKRIKVMWKYRSVFYCFETKKHIQKAFFMTAEFHKDFMLKRLIKKYWQGEVEGDDWDNLKKKYRKWRQKHDTFVPDYSEAEKAEREARKKIREIINLYKAGAEADNKFIKAIYLYETKSRECNNRPKESYSYNVEIEIGKIGYSDDESLYILSEILFVRYGKKSIKVMTDETVYSQISEKLSEAIEK